MEVKRTTKVAINCVMQAMHTPRKKNNKTTIRWECTQCKALECKGAVTTDKNVSIEKWYAVRMLYTSLYDKRKSSHVAFKHKYTNTDDF